MGWYDNSFRGGRSYASATHEEGAADRHGFRDRRATAEQPVVHGSIVPNQERDGHPFSHLPSWWLGWQSRLELGQHSGAGMNHHLVRSNNRNACDNEQAHRADHDDKWDAADWSNSLARS